MVFPAISPVGFETETKRFLCAGNWEFLGDHVDTFGVFYPA
jgi:hypothetical protein